VGQNIDAQYNFIGKFEGLSAVGGVAAAAALPTSLAATNELAFGPSVGRAVWSGEGMASQAARSGLSTLGESPLGQIIPRLPAVFQGAAWATASYLWAAGATGAVVPFVSGLRAESYFVRYELPTLLANPSVRFLPYF